MALIPRSILKYFFIYASGSALLKGLSLGLIPLLLRVVSPHEYGILALAMSIAGITSRLLDLGLRQYLSVDYFKYPPEERPRFILDILIFYTSISVPLLIMLFIAAPLLIPSTTEHPIYLMALCIVTHAFFSFFAELFYQVLRNEQQALLLTSVQSVVTLGTMSLNIYLATRFHTGALGMLIGYIIGLATATMIGVIWLWHKLKQPTTYCFLSLSEHCKRGAGYLPYSLPLLPTTLLSWVLSSGDKWLLALYASLFDVGIYALGDTVGQAYHLLVLYPLGSSYIPYLIQRYAQRKTSLQEVEQQNKKIMAVSLFGLTLLSMGAYWIGKPLLYWVLPLQYQPIIPYIPLLLIGYILLTGTHFLSALIQFHNKRTFLAYSLVVPAITNIALNRLLIPHYRLYGCLYATISAYALYFCGMLWYNMRLTRQLSYLPAKKVRPEKESEAGLPESTEKGQIQTVLNAASLSRNVDSKIKQPKP